MSIIIARLTIGRSRPRRINRWTLLSCRRAHAEWLVQVARLHAIVLPHPHGNLQGWGAALPEAIQDRKLGLGVLLGDAWRNRPPMEDTYALNAASCALNFIRCIPSTRRRVVLLQLPCPNVTHGNSEQTLSERRLDARAAKERDCLDYSTSSVLPRLAHGGVRLPTLTTSRELSVRERCANPQPPSSSARVPSGFDASHHARAARQSSTSTLCAPPPLTCYLARRSPTS